ncbi:MAG: hypothetical protein ACLR0U_33040 [Enterocloster clostridioformis]
MVSDRPKPMALIEGSLMEYSDSVSCPGVADIVFAVGYKGTMVEDISVRAFGFHADYAYEETLLGNGRAAKNAGRFITEDRFMC